MVRLERGKVKQMLATLSVPHRRVNSPTFRAAFKGSQNRKGLARAGSQALLGLLRAEHAHKTCNLLLSTFKATTKIIKIP